MKGRVTIHKKYRVFLCLFLCLILLVIVYKRYINKSYDSIPDYLEYKNTYYIVNIPKEWKKAESNNEISKFNLGEKYVASIDVNPDCNYCSSDASILTILFERSYIDDTIISKFDNYKIIKAYIRREQSAAEQEKGIRYSDQLHYIYTNNKNYWIDLYIDNTVINEEDADFIAKSLLPTID